MQYEHSIVMPLLRSGIHKVCGIHKVTPKCANLPNFKTCIIGQFLVDETATKKLYIIRYYIFHASNMKALAICLHSKVAPTKSHISA